MIDSPDTAQHPDNDGEQESTSPPEPTHEATTPPGGGEVDDESVERSEEDLDQAGGGH